MRILTVLITTFLLCGTVAANERFYIGGNAGVSMFDGTADADPIQFSGTGTMPAEISINGFSFDSNETTWSALVGWRATDWLAVEAGYTDLGNTGREFFAATDGIGVFGGNSVALNIEEWFVGTKFEVPIASDFSANWFVGLTRAEFDVEGELTSLFFFGPDPISNPIVTVRPFAPPDDETGFAWGFGFGWDATDRVTVDVAYRKHNTQVIDVDTLSLGLLFSL